MLSTRVISLDLDDTLWPVAPVIAAAEAALLAWLRATHPRAVQGHDLDSMRALRARIAARFPEHSHDMTFIRRQALAEQFATAGYANPEGVAEAGYVQRRGSTATRSVALAAMLEPAVPIDASVEAALEIFLAARNQVRFYDDVRPALLRLRTKYRLFAVSNGNADLQRCGIADLFDGHITASAAGAAKPDARIFDCLLRDANVAPGEILHIGDDPLADVVGATRAGLQAAWLNRDARVWPAQFEPPSRTISSLAEII